MKANKLLFFTSGLLIVFALSLALAEEAPKAPDAPMDPAVTTAPAPKDPAAAPSAGGTEASPEAPAPAPVPETPKAPPADVKPVEKPAEKSADKPADKPATAPAKKSKKTNKTRKVKTACDILDNPDGKKVGTLKVGSPLWTDEHNESWVKVYRKSSVGYAKTECFE